MILILISFVSIFSIIVSVYAVYLLLNKEETKSIPYFLWSIFMMILAVFMFALSKFI